MMKMNERAVGQLEWTGTNWDRRQGADLRKLLRFQENKIPTQILLDWRESSVDPPIFQVGKRNTVGKRKDLFAELRGLVRGRLLRSILLRHLPNL